MKVPKLPNNIKVHPSAERDIKEIAVLDDKKAGKIFQRLSELGLDPEPMTGECDSDTVLNRTKKKVYIKRLKCIDILDYRIFYAHKKSGMVCIYCVVPRNNDTYKKNSPHYMRIKLLYTQWRDCQ
jgi:mRNA-degrading endonuclease RelE of RelBE toxin-antitoxin system